MQLNQQNSNKNDGLIVPEGSVKETITSVKHYTERLFSFRTTRSAALRFQSGEFVMIGLPDGAKPIFRAYSITSPTWDEELEFYSIKVPDGPLTSKLQKVKIGDPLLIRKKSSGTVILDTLTPGKNLYMLSTGTGIAPFASLVREPETYERFNRVILTHTCRLKAELSYGYHVVESAHTDPLVGEAAKSKLTHVATTTRENSDISGRITALVKSQQLFSILNCKQFDPIDDRIMVCGSMALIKDLKAILSNLGFKEGSHREPGSFVVERAFVD